MIYVEITVPSIDGTYEFKLNEDIPVYTVIEEICSVICEKEQCKLISDSGMMLFGGEGRSALSLNLTLYENGIQNGNKLILA